MQNPVPLIADRLERAADRLLYSGDAFEEQRFREAASSIRAGMDLFEAQEIERQLLFDPQVSLSNQLSTLAAAGEYDEPQPGTHTEIVDGHPVVVPDGSHVEITPGGVTIVPDHPEAPTPPTPTPPNPTPPTPTPPTPTPHEPHEPPTPQPPTPTPPTPPTPQPPATGIDASTGKQVANKAAAVAANYKARGVKYVYGDDASSGGDTSDCSHFVHDVLKQAGLGGIPQTATSQMPGSTHFAKVPGSQAQAGDIIVQNGHMGVYTGGTYVKPDGSVTDAPNGIQMGDHQIGPAPWGPGGWFKGSGPTDFYRPKP